MLVFTRKRDQTIVIGDGIEVRVPRVGRDGVRIGVTRATNVAAAADRDVLGRLAAQLRRRTVARSAS